jgi:hypothetical protein
MNPLPPERLEILNKRLLDHFGKFEDGRANFRISYADDQYEKAISYYTEAGIWTPSPIITERKKYPWLQNKYLLERLIGVIGGDLTEKTSYEPVWVFQDANGNPLPPIWIAIKTVIDSLIEGLGKKKIYKEAFGEGNTKEELEERYKATYQMLYGNETDTTDALSRGDGVGYGPKGGYFGFSDKEKE